MCLHFVVKALGDSVVAGEAPHSNDLLGPGSEHIAELHQLRQDSLAQLFNRAQETGYEFLGSAPLMIKSRHGLESAAGILYGMNMQVHRLIPISTAVILLIIGLACSTQQSSEIDPAILSAFAQTPDAVPASTAKTPQPETGD